MLFAFREALARRREEVAEAITAEHGKVLDDALGEVQRGLEVVEFACGAPHLLKGGFSDGVSTGVDVHSLRQPLGVVAVISPFNFPAMVPLWFVPVAIACGNAVVLKPSEKDPSASLLLAELLGRGRAAGRRLQRRARRQGGGRRAARAPRRARRSRSSARRRSRGTSTRPAPRHGKRVQALGGAKNHMVVLPDADLEAAADAAVSAGFGSAGERCMAISVAGRGRPGRPTQLVPLIAERMAGLRTGDGRRGLRHGPAGDRRAPRQGGVVRRGRASDAGAELVVDGRDVVPDGDADGFWLGPTLFDRVTPGMSVYDDEIFGPVLSVVRVASYDEALALVNANPYGNGTAIFTRDGGAARRYQREVEVGMVGVNVPIPVPMAYYSFGGWKSSLFGDTHAHGTEGVHFYTRGKVVTSRWPDPGAAACWAADGGAAAARRQPGASTCSSPPTSSRVGADGRVSRAESAQMGRVRWMKVRSPRLDRAPR